MLEHFTYTNTFNPHTVTSSGRSYYYFRFLNEETEFALEI